MNVFKMNSTLLRIRIRRFLFHLFLFLMFFLIALVITRPLYKNLKTSLPVGSEPAATVPLLNTFILWWNADRALHLGWNYWQAPLFHPEKNVLLFSETMTPSLMVAPIVWMSETPILGYNLFLLLSLTLNGYLTYRLLKYLEQETSVALTGGLVMELLPVVHFQLGIIQLVPVWGMVWTILRLLKFRNRSTVKRAVLLGFAGALTYHLCANLGLFFGLILFCTWWILCWGHLRSKLFWKYLGIAMGVAVLLLLPLVWGQWNVMKAHQFERPLELMNTLSAQASDFTRAPAKSWLPAWEIENSNRTGWRLSAGYLKYFFALIGLCTGLYRRPLRGWTWFLLSGVLLSFAFSLGMNFKIGSLAPYHFLVDGIPGFAQIRNVFRFAFIFQVLIVLLAAQGLEVLLSDPSRRVINKLADVSINLLLNSLKNLFRALIDTLIKDRSKRSIWKKVSDKFSSWSKKQYKENQWESSLDRPSGRWAAFLVIVLGTALAFEITPVALTLYEVPKLQSNAKWITWLKENSLPTDALVCIPFSQGTSGSDYERTTLWMYWTCFHNRPLVNGYSGFFPKSYLDLKPMMQQFPRNFPVESLVKNGTRFCAVDLNEVSLTDLISDSTSPYKLKFHDPNSQIALFELSP